MAKSRNRKSNTSVDLQAADPGEQSTDNGSIEILTGNDESIAALIAEQSGDILETTEPVDTGDVIEPANDASDTVIESVAANDVSADNAVLEALAAETQSTEVTQTTQMTAETSEEVLEQVEAAAERANVYAGQTGGATILSDAEVEAAAPPAEPPTVTVKKGKPATPRVSYAKQSERLSAVLGAKKRDVLVFNIKDADLDDAALEAKQNERLKAVDALAKKVGEKATMLCQWIRDGRSVDQMNEVMKRAFKLLVTEGKITSGDKGNLQQDLLTKPYSIGTARSQSNQMFMLFPAFEVTVKNGKGEQVPNPESTIFEYVKGMMIAPSTTTATATPEATTA